MPSPLATPGAKTTLVLALLMSLTGFLGLSASFGWLGGGPEVPADASAPPEVARAHDAYVRAVFVDHPLARALSVANLLASGLLLLASVLLTARAGSALWWASQALWANAGFSLARGAAYAHLVGQHREELGAFVRALAATSPEPMPPDTEQALRLTAMAGALLVGAVLAAFFYALLRLSRREAVRSFVSHASAR